MMKKEVQLQYHRPSKSLSNARNTVEYYPIGNAQAGACIAEHRLMLSSDLVAGCLLNPLLRPVYLLAIMPNHTAFLSQGK
jgi:hypothetical protein